MGEKDFPSHLLNNPFQSSSAILLLRQGLTGKFPNRVFRHLIGAMGISCVGAFTQKKEEISLCLFIRNLQSLGYPLLIRRMSTCLFFKQSRDQGSNVPF